MTLDEYIKEKERLTNEYNKSIDDLKLKFCLENTAVKIGDKVEDHIGLVEITKIIGVDSYKRISPSLIFEGIELRKSDEMPKKNGGVRAVYESNIKKIR